MNIQYKTKGAEVSQVDKDYTEGKLKTLVKFMPVEESELRFEVEFSDDPKHISGEVYRVDMVAVGPGRDMHAVGHGESMQAAIDMAKDDLARRVNRKKDKDRSMLRKGSRKLKRMLRMSN